MLLVTDQLPLPRLKLSCVLTPTNAAEVFSQARREGWSALWHQAATGRSLTLLLGPHSERTHDHAPMESKFQEQPHFAGRHFSNLYVITADSAGRWLCHICTFLPQVSPPIPMPFLDPFDTDPANTFSANSENDDTVTSHMYQPTDDDHDQPNIEAEREDELIHEECFGYSEDAARSDEEGWYYDDAD